MGETKGAGSTGLPHPDDHYHGEAEKGSDDMATPRKSTLSPAFQVYPNEFLGDPRVQVMSATEVGVYWLLIMACWNAPDGLPLDMRRLGAIGRTKTAQFERMWAGVLHECFDIRNERVFHRRIEKERKKQADYRKLQKEKAEKSWQSRGRGSALQEHMARHMPADGLQSLSSTLSLSSTPVTVPDGEFQRFQMAYPESRRKGGYLAESLFFAARQKASLEDLLSAIANHKASEQWRAGKIPGMDTWLKDERWVQVLPSDTTAKPSRLTAWRPSDEAAS